MTNHIEHGHDLATPLFLDEDITERSEGLDTGTLHFLARDRHAFITGVMVPVEAYAGLKIMNLRRVNDGSAYEFWLDVKGVNGPKAARRLEGFPEVTHSFTDWDHVEDAWITNNPNQIVEGQIGTFGGSTVCGTARSKPLTSPGWYEVRGSFSGIIRPKPMQRSISVNGQTISGDRITVNLPGGWTTPRKGVVQLPKIVVRDRYHSLSPPPTNLIPGPLKPPNAPQVLFLSVTGTDLTQYWPGGWHLASLASEQMADRGMYVTDWIYEYQYPATP